MFSSAAFNDIDRLASIDSTRIWATEEERAKKERIHDVTVMDIYDIKMKRREFGYSTLILLNNQLQSLLRQTYFLN